MVGSRGRCWLRLIGVGALLACGDDQRPDVLLITVDTLRADRLGSDRTGQSLTPHLDLLAARGVRFRDCTVQWPKTWPSMASFMTGAYPRTTGLRIRPRVIPSSLEVLSEVFAKAGYRTGAVVANVNVGKHLGFDQGFELFIESWQPNWRKQDGAEQDLPKRVKRFTNGRLLSDQALAWTEGLPPDAPFLLWLHYIDPHGPYDPPDRFLSTLPERTPELVPTREIPSYQVRPSDVGEPAIDLTSYKDRYDGEIRYLDTELGRLLERLEATRERRLLVAFTADHGESLGEHGYYLEHGRLPYQASAHVPGILVLEDTLPAGRVIERPVGLIDMARTLVELAGLVPPASFEGTSLLGLAQGTADEGPDYVFMESGYSGIRPQRVVRHGRWKLIQVESPRDRERMTGHKFELYDLHNDPGELHNVAREHPRLVGELAQALGAFAQGAQPDAMPAEVESEAIDEASKNLLRELGYLESEPP